MDDPIHCERNSIFVSKAFVSEFQVLRASRRLTLAGENRKMLRKRIIGRADLLF